MRHPSRLALVLWASAAPALAAAQGTTTPAPATRRAPPVPQVAPSSFATEELRLNGRTIGGSWVPGITGVEGPSVIRISYGQPHARGRRVVGGVVPMDSVWRLGANLATTLHTDVDLTIGTAFVPHGTYTLFTLPRASGWQLIVSRATGEWGTDYDPSQDLVRIPLHSSTLAEPIESLSIYLVPAVAVRDGEPVASTAMPHGTLRIMWERTELTTDWRMGH